MQIEQTLPRLVGLNTEFFETEMAIFFTYGLFWPLANFGAFLIFFEKIAVFGPIFTRSTREREAGLMHAPRQGVSLPCLKRQPDVMISLAVRILSGKKAAVNLVSQWQNRTRRVFAPSPYCGRSAPTWRYSCRDVFCSEQIMVGSRQKMVG